MGNTNFYIPDFWFKFNLNTALIKDIKANTYAYNTFTIKSIYGTFPGAIWNGGRCLYGEEPWNVKETIDEINSLGVAVRFTFTNCLLKKKHLADEYCNRIMEQANNGMNEVIVNSPILEKYLREKYPNFKYISSTTKCITDPKLVCEEIDKYYLTVLDYRFNHDYGFLESIANKDKVELLINPYCPSDCKRRAEHYKILSKWQLQNKIDDNPFQCPSETKTFFQIRNNEAFITKEQLYSDYAEIGYQHFKIEGRNNTILDNLETYMYYLVKPEYKDETRFRILSQLYT